MTGVSVSSAVSSAVVPAPYRRPTELDGPPPSGTAYVAWLEAVPVIRSPRDGTLLRYEVRHAFAAWSVDRTELLWKVDTLAHDVDPLAGAQLVDGLRALRRRDDARSRWYRVGPLARRS